MKQHHTKYRPKYREYILSHITEDHAGNSLTTDKERASFLFERFRSEYGWRIEQAGKRQAMTDWLSGLAIPFACYNGDIIDLAIRFGSIDPDPSPQLIDRVLENYFSFMADIVLGMETMVQDRLTSSDKVRIVQSGQGLLSVEINGKPTEWKVKNEGGQWLVYGYGRQSVFDLAQHVHKDSMNLMVAWVISNLQPEAV